MWGRYAPRVPLQINAERERREPCSVRVTFLPIVKSRREQSKPLDYVNGGSRAECPNRLDCPNGRM